MRPKSSFAAIILGLTYVFCYVQPDLTARIYVLNCGLPLVLLYVAFRLRHLATGRLIDRLLFWVFLGFTLHFFPRTLLSADSAGSSLSLDSFRESAFWLLFQFSMVVLGGIMIMTLLATLGRRRHRRHPQGPRHRSADGAAEPPRLRTPGGGQDRDRRVAPGQPDRLRYRQLQSINDNYGHAVGDAVLTEFGDIMRRTIRDGDIPARIGGEEFAILCQLRRGRRPSLRRASAHRTDGGALFRHPAFADRHRKSRNRPAPSPGAAVEPGIPRRRAALRRQACRQEPQLRRCLAGQARAARRGPDIAEIGP